MNKDLIREKLSNTIETIEQTKTILELNYEKKNEVDFTSYKRREELDKLITKIRMNTLACLIQMSETDDLSDLSPDEQELYYEYESIRKVSKKEVSECVDDSITNQLDELSGGEFNSLEELYDAYKQEQKMIKELDLHILQTEMKEEMG